MRYRALVFLLALAGCYAPEQAAEYCAAHGHAGDALCEEETAARWNAAISASFADDAASFSAAAAKFAAPPPPVTLSQPPPYVPPALDPTPPLYGAWRPPPPVVYCMGVLPITPYDPADGNPCTQ